MDISKFATTPKLEKLTLDGEDVVKEFGEEISFYMMDQMDISTYFNFYRLQQNEDGNLLNDLLRKLILNEKGKPVLGEDQVFPVNLTLAILVKINDYLGKSKTITSTPTTGEQQN
jgi:hypothetical protein